MDASLGNLIASEIDFRTNPGDVLVFSLSLA
jgi:hypothetical protein